MSQRESFVLARNYHGEPKWVHGAVISLTGAVSYTVQTADTVWSRHVDQLLQTSPVTVELPPGDSSDVLVDETDHLQPQVQNSATSESKNPIMDVTTGSVETPSLASSPIAGVLLKDSETDVPMGSFILPESGGLPHVWI